MALRPSATATAGASAPTASESVVAPDVLGSCRATPAYTTLLGVFASEGFQTVAAAAPASAASAASAPAPPRLFQAGILGTRTLTLRFAGAAPASDASDARLAEGGGGGSSCRAARSALSTTRWSRWWSWRVVVEDRIAACRRLRSVRVLDRGLRSAEKKLLMGRIELN